MGGVTLTSMREATALAMVLAILMGLLAVTQLDSVTTAVQAVTTGPLSQFIGLWPYIMVGLLVMVVVAFAVSAFSRK